MVLYGHENVEYKYIHKNGLLSFSSHKYPRPRFIVLTARKEERRYDRVGADFTVWVFQVMDGSNCIMKAVTDTSSTGGCRMLTSCLGLPSSFLP